MTLPASKRYNRKVLLGMCTVTMVYFLAYHLVEYAGWPIQQMPFRQLFDYQMDKAGKSATELAFIGDSALGNAIDASVFSDRSDMSAENFALTGSFGLEGSLRMLQEVQRHDSHLKYVVIIQSVDLFSRDAAERFEPPQRYFTEVYSRGLDFSIFNYQAFRQLVKTLLRHAQARDARPVVLDHDYVVQQAAIDPALASLKLGPRDINPGKAAVLEKIAVFCSEHQLQCIYAHGPVLAPLCTGNAEYMAEVNRQILAAGMGLVEESPVCIDPSHIGDSADHVGPAFKARYTQTYYSLLEPWLRGH